MSCTDSGPFDGGTYNDPVINNPVITGGESTGATLNNPSINGSVSLDTAAAQSILNAVQEVEPVQVVAHPAQTDAESLPTVMIGEDRSVVLGKPAGFLKLGSFIIPYYRPE